jgi:hypothetical protein
MGYGEVGSNGSVHWNINYKEDGPLNNNGVDRSKKHPGDYGNPNPRVIGSGKPKGDHRGTFRVILRYRTAAEATAALAAAKTTPYNGGVEIEVDVPVRPFQDTPGNPNGWEIRVDW